MDHSDRRVGVDAARLASAAYNDNPEPMRISGVREAHQRLFGALPRLALSSERARFLHGYMRETFGAAANLSAKAAHLRYLLGWMLDSNSREGAALKGWVQSRFGLVPTWHRGRLNEDSAALKGFEAGLGQALRLDPRAFDMFDVIYEFAQYELAMLPYSHIVLYRGTGHLTGQLGIMEKGATRRVVTFNCLNSFTREFERAWEFGDRVLEARIPLTKVFFDDSIFKTGIVTGEEEVIVLGGEFEVGLRW